MMQTDFDMSPPAVDENRGTNDERRVPAVRAKEGESQKVAVGKFVRLLRDGLKNNIA